LPSKISNIHSRCRNGGPAGPMITELASVLKG
jgi:hypothetical protein